MTTIEQIFELFESKGKEAYRGEPVSQAAHALQAAFFAGQEQAPNTLVAAALLHDVGHLLPDHGGQHEIAGEQFLLNAFGPAVSEPVRLHVDAKRYLCFSDPEYLDALSPASVQSLALQGGPLTAEQAAQFQANLYHNEAIRLRLWDDQAKLPGLNVPGLEYYRGVLERALLDEVCPA